MLFYGIAAGCEAHRRGRRLERGAVPDVVPDRRGLDGRLARARDGVPARPDAVRLQLRAVPVPGRAVHVPRPQPARVRGRRHAAAAVLHRRRVCWRWRSPSRRTSRTSAGRSWPPGPSSARRVLSVVLMATTTLAAPGLRASIRRPGMPVATLFPAQLRLLTPFLNITGAFALILARSSRRTCSCPSGGCCAYSLDPNQPGDQFLFNLLIAPVAIIVNLVASLPGAVRALARRPASTAASRRRSSSRSGRSSRR